MRFIQTHATGSDETAPYDVKDFPATVKEFIDEVLTRNEWGNIKIDGLRDKIEYKGSKLLNEIPHEWLERTIVEVKAAGGWSCMDYLVKVKPTYQITVMRMQFTGKDIDSWFKLPMVRSVHKPMEAGGRMFIALADEKDAAYITKYQYLFQGDTLVIDGCGFRIERQ